MVQWYFIMYLGAVIFLKFCIWFSKILLCTIIPKHKSVRTVDYTNTVHKSRHILSTNLYPSNPKFLKMWGLNLTLHCPGSSIGLVVLGWPGLVMSVFFTVALGCCTICALIWLMWDCQLHLIQSIPTAAAAHSRALRSGHIDPQICHYSTPTATAPTPFTWAPSATVLRTPKRASKDAGDESPAWSPAMTLTSIPTSHNFEGGYICTIDGYQKGTRACSPSSNNHSKH